MCSKNVGARINLKLYSLHVNLLMKITNGNGRSCYRLASWNCRKGLICGNKLPTTKMTEVKMFLYEMNLDLLCVIETDIHSFRSNNLVRQKLSQEEVDHALHVRGYKLYFPKSWYEHRVARILIFAKTELKLTVRGQSIAQSDLPTFTCEINLGNERKTIVNCF